MPNQIFDDLGNTNIGIFPYSISNLAKFIPSKTDDGSPTIEKIFHLVFSYPSKEVVEGNTEISSM